MLSSRNFLHSLCFQLSVQQPPKKISLSISNNIPIIYISNLNHSHTDTWQNNETDENTAGSGSLSSGSARSGPRPDSNLESSNGLVFEPFDHFNLFHHFHFHNWESSIALGWILNLLAILISFITFTIWNLSMQCIIFHINTRHVQHVTCSIFTSSIKKVSSVPYIPNTSHITNPK